MIEIFIDDDDDAMLEQQDADDLRHAPFTSRFSDMPRLCITIYFPFKSILSFMLHVTTRPLCLSKKERKQSKNFKIYWRRIYASPFAAIVAILFRRYREKALPERKSAR